MAQIDFKLRKWLSGDVYRWVRHWKAIEAHHSTKTAPRFYLLLHVDVRWEHGEKPHEIFTILMQHSASVGQDVQLRKPAHIEPEDAPLVARQFAAFVDLFAGEDPPPTELPG